MIPYRAKNPPERTPYITWGLIALNVLIYAVTSENGIFIRGEVVKDWAVSHDTMNPIRMVTAMFLHQNPMHLIGNMLFLWIFGSAVEGRLGHLKYIATYLVAGLGADLLHDFVVGLMNPEQFSLGASGAIMGLAGMYVFLFPFARICVFMGWSWARFAMGWDVLSEWHAQWVVLYFIGWDIFNGLLFRAAGMSGGVAHFARIGGFVAGFLLMLLLRERRDSEEASDAQAMRADARGDVDILSMHDLEALVEREPDNAVWAMALIRKSLRQTSVSAKTIGEAVLIRKLPLLLTQADPDELGRLALALLSDSPRITGPMLLRIAGAAETAGSYDVASDLYSRVTGDPINHAESEMALLRYGRLLEKMRDLPTAANVYADFLRRFPHGSHAASARAALNRLGITPPPPAPIIPHTPQPTPAPDTRRSAEDSGLASIQGRIQHAAPAPPAPDNATPTNGVDPDNPFGLRPIGS